TLRWLASRSCARGVRLAKALAVSRHELFRVALIAGSFFAMTLEMAYMDSSRWASRRDDRGEIRQVQSYIRPVWNVSFTSWPSGRTCTPGANHSSTASKAWSFLDLVRCRSDRLRHDRRSSPCTL